MKHTFIAASILAITGSGAMAQGVTYADVEYSFNQLDAFGTELTNNQIRGIVEYTTGQFLLSGDLQYTNVDTGSDSGSFTRLQGSAAYMITPQTLVGAGLNGLNGDGVDIYGWEAFGQYVDPTFGVAISVVQADSDEDDRLTTVYGEYMVMPELALGVQLSQFTDQDSTTVFLSGDYDTGPVNLRGYYQTNTDDDGGLIGLRGDYMATPDIRVGGSYQTFVGGDADEFDAYAVTGGYQVSNGVWIDALYGRLSGLGGDDIDRVELSISFETGDQKRMDRRMEDDELEDLRAGIGAVFFF